MALAIVGILLAVLWPQSLVGSDLVDAVHNIYYVTGTQTHGYECKNMTKFVKLYVKD